MRTTKQTIQLTSADGAQFAAYHVRPEVEAKAAIVVLQEIFGLNAHIRGVADDYAAQGYEVMAPALFDRIERGVELGYDAEGLAKARQFPPKLGWDDPLRDIAATVAALTAVGKVGVVGYCWGGSLAYLCSTRLSGISAAVGYYGSAIARHAHEVPRVPTLLHFGENDQSIPATDVDNIRSQRPEVLVQVYPAGHGFNCDARASYSQPSAELARQRSLAFFAEHLS